MKSDLVIRDEIGYTPIEKREANLFFNLISETYEKAFMIVTSNKSFVSWAEMMGDSVMITAMLDRLLHHARIFTLDGESYRIKIKTRRYDHFWLTEKWEFIVVVLRPLKFLGELLIIDHSKN